MNSAQQSMMQLPDLAGLAARQILITGGTGSLGRMLTRVLLDHSEATKIVIFSRDEFKQSEMATTFSPEQLSRLRFFLGDVRDRKRLQRAFNGIDCVIHTAALKQVPAAEYNPFEFVKTNIIGAENVINAAIDSGVKRVVALSTDKAAAPINLYGATKLCADKLFVAGNNYAGVGGCRFSVVRYGNVLGSRGSVVPFFLERRKTGILPITDLRMTRFWITIEQGANFVLNVLRTMRGGEIFVPRIPSMKIVDLANAIAPDCTLEEVGIRPGEKLHESMITSDDARQSLEFDTHYVICPLVSDWDAELAPSLNGEQCPEGFQYCSDTNDQWLDCEQLINILKQAGIL